MVVYYPKMTSITSRREKNTHRHGRIWKSIQIPLVRYL